MQVTWRTLSDIGAGDKPEIVVFNKIDAYTFVEKEADDLTPRTKANWTLQELQQSWMGRLGNDCIFLSARERTNLEAFRQLLYKKVRELHVQKYPYNDFLYDTYEDQEA